LSLATILSDKEDHVSLSKKTSDEKEEISLLPSPLLALLPYTMSQQQQNAASTME